MTRRIFEFIDNDKNGSIEGEEIVNFMRMMNSKTHVACLSLLSHLSEREKK